MPAQGKVNGQTQWLETESVLTGWLLPVGEVSSLGEARLHSPLEDHILHTLPVLIETIYRAPEAVSIELAAALRLLPQAVEWCQKAIGAIEAENIIESDDAMIHLHSLMPEFFAAVGLARVLPPS